MKVVKLIFSGVRRDQDTNEFFPAFKLISYQDTENDIFLALKDDQTLIYLLQGDILNAIEDYIYELHALQEQFKESIHAPGKYKLSRNIRDDLYWEFYEARDNLKSLYFPSNAEAQICGIFNHHYPSRDDSVLLDITIEIELEMLEILKDYFNEKNKDSTF